MRSFLLLPVLAFLCSCTSEPPAVKFADAEPQAVVVKQDAKKPSETTPVRDVETLKESQIKTTPVAEPTAPAPKKAAKEPIAVTENKTATKAAPPASKTSPQETPRRTKSVAPETPAASARQTKAAYPILTFKSTVWNFGELEEGTTVDHKFEFTNTGDAPLEITNTEATCGCTKPLYPFIPIMPGETSYISVRYNSTGKFGTQKPKVTVYANTREKKHLLYLEGSVKTEVVQH